MLHPNIRSEKALLTALGAVVVLIVVLQWWSLHAFA
jgi:hypothetical protein